MAERGLKKEIKDMLSLVRGKWVLRSIMNGPRIYMYEIVKPTEFFYVLAVSGRGCTKQAALRDLLAKWRNGESAAGLECPAGSTEELKLKLVIRGNDDGETRS